MLLPSLSSLLTPEPNLFPLGRAGEGKTSPTLLLPIKPTPGMTIWPLSSLPSVCFFFLIFPVAKLPGMNDQGQRAMSETSRYYHRAINTVNNLPAPAGPPGMAATHTTCCMQEWTAGRSHRTSSLLCCTPSPAQGYRGMPGTCPHACDKPMYGVQQQHMH